MLLYIYFSADNMYIPDKNLNFFTSDAFLYTTFIVSWGVMVVDIDIFVSISIQSVIFTSYNFSYRLTCNNCFKGSISIDKYAQTLILIHKNGLSLQNF